MTYRILGSVVVLFSILVLPYWIYIPILFLVIIFFPFFWEGIFLTFLIDVIHGNGMGDIYTLISPFSFATLILIIILLPIRERLRLYV